MQTTTINFALKLPSGQPVNGGSVTFALTGFDLDGAIILPTSVDANIAPDGTGSISVWPNALGLKATTYKVTISPSGGQKLELSGVTVPISNTPIALHTLGPFGLVGGMKTVVLTQSAYDALPGKDAQTLYLIRAE